MTSPENSLVGPVLPLCDGDWHSLEITQTKDKLHFRLDEFVKTISVSGPIQHVAVGSLQRGYLLLLVSMFGKSVRVTVLKTSLV